MTETKSTEKFRVFLAEDNEDIVRGLTMDIEEIGGVVVRAIGNLEEALEFVLKLEEERIDLVILGGSLDGGYEMGSPDSLAILAAMNEAKVNAKTIAYTGDIHSRLASVVDAEVFKWDFDALIPTIIKLLALEADDSQEK